MKMNNMLAKRNSFLVNPFTDRKLSSIKESLAVIPSINEIDHKSQSFLLKQFVKSHKQINRRQKYLYTQNKVHKSILIPRLKISKYTEVSSSQVLALKKNGSLNNKSIFDERKILFKQTLCKRSNRSFSQMRAIAPKILNIHKLNLCRRNIKLNSSRIVHKEHSATATKSSMKQIRDIENISEVMRMDSSAVFKTRREIINISRIKQYSYSKTKMFYDLVRKTKLKNIPVIRKSVELKEGEKPIRDLKRGLNVNDNESVTLYPKIFVGDDLLTYKLNVRDCFFYEVNHLIFY